MRKMSITEKIVGGVAVGILVLVIQANIHDAIRVRRAHAELEKSNEEFTQWIRREGRAQGKKFVDMTYENEIAIGMSADLVRKSWGEPAEINRTIVSGEVHEQWIYNHNDSERHHRCFNDMREFDDVYVYVDNDILTGIQEHGSNFPCGTPRTNW